MTHFKGQKYASLRKHCLQSGELFCDPDFPASSKSLFYSRVESHVAWKRPKELSKVPRLIVENSTADDLDIGPFGSVIFQASCSALLQSPKYWQKVVPEHRQQEFDTDNYAGIFRFRLWSGGQWHEVVIDDRLPVDRDDGLLFTRSRQRPEFWACLLEKACAKFTGDYESLLRGGCAVDTLVDFTGGVAQKLTITDDPSFFDTVLSTSQEHETFMLATAATVDGENSDTCGKCEQCWNCLRREQILPKEDATDAKTAKSTKLEATDERHGLTAGGIYVVSEVARLAVNRALQQVVGTESLSMIRLKTPRTDEQWTGSWSESSPEWQAISQTERENLGLRFKNDAEFWMSFQDFCKQFDQLDTCLIPNTAVLTLKSTWSETQCAGAWIARLGAGGSESSPNFLLNPQFALDITANSGDQFIISLEQMSPPQKLNQIGFYILETDLNRRYRVHRTSQIIRRCDQFPRSRNCYMETSLPRGRYVVLACTQQPEQLGRFLLRAYSRVSSKCWELTEDAPKQTGCCASGACQVVTVRLEKAVELERTQKDGSKDDEIGFNTYCTVRCESETVRTRTVVNSSQPEWNSDVTFYKKKPYSPITIEVMLEKRVRDECLGVATCEELSSEAGRHLNLKLYDKKVKDVKRAGELQIFLQTSDDLLAL